MLLAFCIGGQICTTGSFDAQECFSINGGADRKLAHPAD
jgi:hypothetical protein